MKRSRVPVWIVVALLAACRSDEPGAGGPDGRVAPGDPDAAPGTPDAGAPDAGAPDASAPDAMPSATEVRFPSLVSGQIVGGAQVTRVDARSSATVRRVELFLDTARIASAELAPFDLAWSTTGFTEGNRELRARAYLGDGATVDAAIAIRIDNTSPVIGALPAVIERGAVLDLPVSDNERVARVEVVTASGTVAVTAPPFRVTWDGSCGTGRLTVRAIDVAGWTTSRDVDVTTQLRDDHDCDGARAIGAGGIDCDDENPAVHPGAADDAWSGIDTNCDGIPGVDGDGDGVPSTRSGGADCNDGRGDVHGAHIRWRRVPLLFAGREVRWAPGRAAAARSSIGVFEVHLLVESGGSLDYYGFAPDGSSVRRTLATGVSAAPVRLAAASGWLVTAYVKNDELHLVRWNGVGEPSDVLLASGSLVPSILGVGTYQGRADVLFGQGSVTRASVRYPDGTGLDYQVGTEAASESLWIDSPRIRMLGWNATTLWWGNHRRDQLDLRSRPRPARFVGAVAVPSGNAETVYSARITSGGTHVEDHTGLTYTTRGENPLSAQRLVLPHLGVTMLVATENNHTWAVRFDAGAGDSRWFPLTGLTGVVDIGTLVTGSSDGASAVVFAPGVAFVVERSEPPAPDGIGDGDLDCDGNDD